MTGPLIVVHFWPLTSALAYLFFNFSDLCPRCWRLGALFIQPKIPDISVKASNGTDHFGLVRPEYLGPALKVAHFDRSGYLGRSDRNDPFYVTKLLSPVPTFFYPACKNNNQTRGGLGRVCATGTYRSTGHVELPKFQTWIFVEWKARLLYRVSCFSLLSCSWRPTTKRTISR